MPTDLPAVRQVGRRFERVHLAGLEACDEVEMLAANRPLRAQGRTLGELDTLFRWRDEVVHREVAVKFYLAVGSEDEPAAWIGPGRRDRLDRKLDRLSDHQLALPERARRAAAWPEDLPFPDRSEVLLTGMLFAPPGASRVPRGAAPTVTTGTWWYASDFARRCGGQGWAEVVKPWWLSPQHVLDLPLEPGAAIAARVSADARPRLVGQAQGTTIARAFVVPDGWWDDPALQP